MRHWNTGKELNGESFWSKDVCGLFWGTGQCTLVSHCNFCPTGGNFFFINYFSFDLTDKLLFDLKMTTTRCLEIQLSLFLPTSLAFFFVSFLFVLQRFNICAKHQSGFPIEHWFVRRNELNQVIPPPPFYVRTSVYLGPLYNKNQTDALSF